MNFYKILKPYKLVILTILLSACASVQDTNLIYKNEQSEAQACPKPKFKFVSVHRLTNFNGCRDGETFYFSDGTNFECKETINVRNYSGTVTLLRKFDDKLKCGKFVEGARKMLIKQCEEWGKDRFEWKVTQGRWKRLDSFAMPVQFNGDIRFYSLEHRIVLDSLNEVSYRVFLENDRYDAFTLCEMVDAKGKRFWFDIY